MIAVPFIYFTLLAIYLIRKHGGVDISAFIVIIYALSAACSILIDISDIYESHGICEKQMISPLATFCYCTLISFATLPFSRINSRDIQNVDIQKEQLVDLLSWVLIITFFITLISTFANLEEVLQSNLKDIRRDIYNNPTGEKLTGIRWLLAIPETLFSQFSPIAIIFYFLNVSKQRKSTLFNWLLLLSSLTPVIKSILIAGRTQPIYWFLSFMAIYIFFRPILSSEQRKKALMPFMAFGGTVGLFIGAVTIARFATIGITNDTGIFDSLLAYSGQSFINFNYFFCNFTPHDIHFDRLIPLTNYFFIHPGWDLIDYREMIWSYSGMNIGVFYTFLGDLLVDLGQIGMLAYVLLFSLISTFVCQSANHDGTIALSRLLVILILYLVPLQGLFFYSYYKVNVSYFIIGTLLFCWMLSHSIKKWK